MVAKLLPLLKISTISYPFRNKVIIREGFSLKPVDAGMNKITRQIQPKTVAMFPRFSNRKGAM
jgi:hypothetical protein